MTEDKWLGIYLRRRRWVERALWSALLLGSALANTITTNLDIRRAGLRFDTWEPAVWEFSSAFVWMVLIPWIVRAADTKPLRWGVLRRHLPWHVLFALMTSLAHVLGMVALRKLAMCETMLERTASRAATISSTVESPRDAIVSATASSSASWTRRTNASSPCEPDGLPSRDTSSSVWFFF